MSREHFKNLKINFCVDETKQHYPEHCLPEKLNKRTGKARHCSFEEICSNLYEKEARMVAFHTTQPRLYAWIKALEILYYDNLGEDAKYIVGWQDEPERWTNTNSAKNAIVISIHSDSGKDENSRQYQLRFFITTGTIHTVYKRTVPQPDIASKFK